MSQRRYELIDFEWSIPSLTAPLSLNAAEVARTRAERLEKTRHSKVRRTPKQ